MNYCPTCREPIDTGSGHLSWCYPLRALEARVKELEEYKKKQEELHALIDDTETQAPPGFDGG